MASLYLACGALARELVTLSKSYGWEKDIVISCLPASWHNHPERIAPTIKRKIRAAKMSGRYDRIFVLYGDCGTGGALDAVLREEQVERISGPHCYEFFSGTEQFSQWCENEPGTFFLTDYLTRHFDRLVIRGLGLDRHPELREAYFGNYHKLVYIAQTQAPDLYSKAMRAAARLDLEFSYLYCGFGGLETFMKEKEWHS